MPRALAAAHDEGLPGRRRRAVVPSVVPSDAREGDFEQLVHLAKTEMHVRGPVGSWYLELVVVQLAPVVVRLNLQRKLGSLQQWLCVHSS